MKLQVKPNGWSCLATAFAMVLGIPTQDFFTLVGHDGSLIVNPTMDDPMARAGIHLQEAITACWRLGYSVTPFELAPAAMSFVGQTPRMVGSEKDNWLRFTTHIQLGRGVIECVGPRFGHAVAFHKGRIFDPDGEEFDYSREAFESRNQFTVRLWRVERRV